MEKYLHLHSLTTPALIALVSFVSALDFWNPANTRASVGRTALISLGNDSPYSRFLAELITSPDVDSLDLFDYLISPRRHFVPNAAPGPDYRAYCWALFMNKKAFATGLLSPYSNGFFELSD